MKGKSIAELETFAREAQAVALRLLADAGYEKVQIVSGGAWAREQSQASPGEVIFLSYEARKGPGATRATPEERFVVRARATGPAHKTLRASIVQSPDDMV